MDESQTGCYSYQRAMCHVLCELLIDNEETAEHGAQNTV